ncbi:MAG: AAA family ATPase [Verrucomicrobia bacterium]|nr:AAA family ATPase [Verrucomicrobiota bacterium]
MLTIESLRKALDLSPDNIPLRLLYAQACLDENALDEGRNSYRRILEREPGNQEAKLGLARFAQLSGNVSEAIVRTDALTEESPTFAAAWIFRARLALGEKDHAEAAGFYRRALELDPNIRDAELEHQLGIQPTEPTRELLPSVTQDESWAEPSEFAETDSDGLGEVERPEVSFDDVGGMESVKEEIRMKIIYPLKNRELFRAYGKRLGGGVLLYGPPGCGKTLISQATASEIQASFIAIALHQVLDLYVGNSEKNLRQLFQLARDHAPAILFFDEVDALAADRKDLRSSAMRTVINQLLAEMDNSNGNNDGVLILGATNAPWHLDPAFRRPGRFDRLIFVPPPDDAARVAIVEILARDKPVEKLDPLALAKRTKGFSGADLRAVFDVATERALARALKEGRIIPLTMEELIQAAKSLNPTTKAWFESAKNYALYANQTGFYDDVLAFLGLRK